MSGPNQIKIIEVTPENIDQTGFFCYMSKRNSEGYRQKLDWIQARFKEGLQIRMLELPERGFIEFLPGEYAWRAVNAAGYLFIHCLWVVGKSKGQGLGGVLLETCVQEAKKLGMNGVAMVTSERVWLAKQALLLKHGFQSVDAAPPFHLMVKKFNTAPNPAFTNDWEQKAKRYGQGFTVMRSAQCPYMPDATNAVLEFAREWGIPAQTVELKTCEDVRNLTPSPYGVFSIIYNGQLLAYHYLLSKDLAKLIKM
jgi:GNAT superfamily N-acetyltransferase